MEDADIIALYWARSERAISETAAKYGSYCYAIAHNILADSEDARESVNDAYLNVWNAIPPHRPDALSAFLGKIVRRVSIDKWRRQNAQKRGGGQICVAIEELSSCLPSTACVEEQTDAAQLAAILDFFLTTLSTAERRVFLCRYWYLDSISSISKRYGFSESKVKVMLHRTRKKLQRYLEKEELL